MHIGISGPIAAGKSTLAKELEKQALAHQLDARIVPFAYGIREIVAMEPVTTRVPFIATMFTHWGVDAAKAHWAALLVDQAMVEYPSTSGVKNRRLLQIIGTEIGRNSVHTDVWVNRAKMIFRQYPFLDFGISDDLRFDNEALSVDVHVAIALNTGEHVTAYHNRRAALSASYTFSDHASEHSLSYVPLLTIPFGFTDDDVHTLFTKLNDIRRLRY